MERHLLLQLPLSISLLLSISHTYRLTEWFHRSVELSIIFIIINVRDSDNYDTKVYKHHYYRRHIVMIVAYCHVEMLMYCEIRLLKRDTGSACVNVCTLHVYNVCMQSRTRENTLC